MIQRTRLVLAAAAAVTGAVLVPTASAHSGHAEHATQNPFAQCSGNPAQPRVISYPVDGQTARAMVAFPKAKPRGIVVFDHGYGHTMYSWQRHAARTAAQLGVIAIAPNYRGQRDFRPAKPGALPSSRGWRVAEGARDSIVAAQLAELACKPSGPNVVYGVSMGGNTSGLVVASQPKDPAGAPLFDWWVDVEGAANVTETYLGASAIAPANAFAANAKADIEEAFGGTLAEVPDVYAERTVVNRAADIATSGVKGVVMVHGVADGLVTYDESRQLEAALEARGLRVGMHTWVTRSEGAEPGTTVDGYLPTGQTSPFAGHASESSETHDVGNMGFSLLAALYKPNGIDPTCDHAVHDGRSGQTVYANGVC